MLDQMVDAMVTILNQRLGEKCAIKWEQRELAALKPYLQWGTRASDRARSGGIRSLRWAGKKGL